MARLYNTIKSKRLAIFLLILLTLSAIVGMTIPQEGLFPEEYQAWANRYSGLRPVIELLQLHEVFYSKWFIVLACIFLINLGACTFEQLRTAKRLWIFYRGNKWDSENLGLEKKLCLGTTDLQQVTSKINRVLQQQGYRAKFNSTAGAYSKHVTGVWGGSIFHVGLVIIVAASLCSAYFKMHGYMMLGEGEVRREAHEFYSYLQEAPFFNEQHSNFALSLLEQDRVLDQDNKLDYIRSSIVIEVEEGESQEYIVEKGKPAEYKDYRIFHYDNGFAPLVTISQGDSPLLKTYLILNTEQQEDNDRYHVEGTKIPQSDVLFDVEYIPGTEGSYRLRLYDGSRTLFEGKVREEEELTVNGYNINFGEMKYWTGFVIVKDPGAVWLFFGGWVALLGLIMLYLLRPRFITFSLRLDESTGETHVQILGKSIKHQRIFKEEFDELVSKIAKINLEEVADVG